MTRPERYRQHAAQCLRAAQLARTASAQKLLTDMAQRWNEIADRAEQVPLKPVDEKVRTGVGPSREQLKAS